MTSAATTQPKENAVYDALTDDAAAIAQKVDHMTRVGHDSARRYDRCRKAANDLAAVVYAYVEDPSCIDIESLREAWQAFIQQDSGNFSSDPEPELTRE